MRRVFEVCALGVEVAEDRGHTAIVAAGRGDGFVAVSLLAYLDGTDSAVEEVQRIGRERTVRAVVVDPFSPAATLIKPLSAAGVSVRQPSSHDTAVAHGVFRDELAAGRLRHAGEPELTAAVRHGTQRRLGGGAAWERRGQPVDVSPLTAATLAVWALVVRNADYDVLSSVW